MVMDNVSGYFNIRFLCDPPVKGTYETDEEYLQRLQEFKNAMDQQMGCPDMNSPYNSQQAADMKDVTPEQLKIVFKE